MSDAADSSLKILIELGLVGEGEAERAKATLGQTTQATHELTYETRNASEAAGEHEKKVEGMRGAFGELNRLLPGVGELLRGVFEGPVGVAIGLALAVEGIRDKLKDYNTELDKIPAAELAEHQKHLEDLQQAWINNQEEVGKYYAKLATAGENADPTIKQIEDLKKITDARIEQSKRMEIQLGREEIANLRATGASPEAIAAAEERNRRTIAQMDAQKSIADGSGNLEAEQKADQANRLPLIEKANQAIQDEQAPKARLENIQERLKEAEAILNQKNEPGLDLERRREAAARNLGNLQNAPNKVADPNVPGGFIDITAANAQARAAAQAELDRVDAERKRIEAEAASLRAQLREAQTAASAAEERAQKAQEASEANKARLENYPPAIGQAKTLEGIQSAGDKALDILNTQVPGLKMTFEQLLLKTGESHAAIGNIVNGILAGTLKFTNVMTQFTAQLHAQDQRLGQIQSQLNNHNSWGGTTY